MRATCSRRQYGDGTNLVTLHSVDQRVTWYPPWTRGGVASVTVKCSHHQDSMSYPGGHPHMCSGLWLGRGRDETTVELAGSEQTDHVRLTHRRWLHNNSANDKQIRLTVGGHTIATTKTLGRPIGSKPDRVPNESRELTTLLLLYTRLAVCTADSRCLRTRLKKVPIIDVLRHLFLLNKWQYRDKYIILIVVVSEKIQLKNVKWCREWYLNLGSPAAMAGTLSTEPQRELVADADQAYFIITVSYWPCAGTGDRYTHG